MARKGAFVAQYDVGEAAAAGAAGILSVANPEERDVFITRVLVIPSNAGDAETSINVGVGVDGAASYNNIFAANRADRLTDIQDNLAAAGEIESILWEADHFLTISKNAGAADSEFNMAGQVFVEYVRI